MLLVILKKLIVIKNNNFTPIFINVMIRKITDFDTKTK